MNMTRKIPTDIYSAKVTETYRPLFAKHMEFIRASKYYLYFEKVENTYKEILSNTIIEDVITDLKEAKIGVTSIINPQPVSKKRFKKLQIKRGYITPLEGVKLYKSQPAIKRDNEKGKTKIKKLGALI